MSNAIRPAGQAHIPMPQAGCNAPTQLASIALHVREAPHPILGRALRGVGPLSLGAEYMANAPKPAPPPATMLPLHCRARLESDVHVQRLRGDSPDMQDGHRESVPTIDAVRSPSQPPSPSVKAKGPSNTRSSERAQCTAQQLHRHGAPDTADALPHAQKHLSARPCEALGICSTRCARSGRCRVSHNASRHAAARPLYI